MSPWLKNYFQSDDLPPEDVIKSAYKAACNVSDNPEKFPNADFTTVRRLIEEMETNAEMCNIIE